MPADDLLPGLREQLVAAAAGEPVVEPTCGRCDGEQSVLVPEHGCGDDETTCQSLCPVPVLVQCPDCTPQCETAPLHFDTEPF